MISSVTTEEMQTSHNEIDIHHSFTLPNIAEFPVSDFFNVPFTHHTRILAMCKDINARYYYIRRAGEERLSVEALKKLIKQQAYEKRDTLPNNFEQTIFQTSRRFARPCRHHQIHVQENVEAKRQKYGDTNQGNVVEGHQGGTRTILERGGKTKRRTQDAHSFCF